MVSQVPRHIDILLVEDNPADVLLAREALGEAELPSTVHVVEDGATAISFLHRQGQYAAAPRPTLVLLDLNLPQEWARGPGRDQAGPRCAASPWSS